MITTVLLLALWPANMTTAAAGLSVEKRELTNICWHDAKTGFYAIKTMECDGAHRSVTLTKDRRVIEDHGYNVVRFPGNADEGTVNITERAFEAVTKSGIKMGASRDFVLKKLGKPYKAAARGSKKEFQCLLYKRASLDKNKEGEVLRNSYIFKNGKLIELFLNLDAVPGCGDDSLSDEGWPWTRF